MTNYDITIIIPNYNRGTFIKKCVDSVISVKDLRVECIVIDDCSIDDSRSILESNYSSCQNIKLFFNPKNIGVQDSRNIGLEYACSNLVMFLDSDDFLESNTLKEKISYIRRNNLVSLFSSYRVIYQNNTYCLYKNVLINFNIPPANYRDALINFKILPTGSIIFDKYKFNNFKFDNTLISGHDDDLILNLIKFGNFGYHNSISYNFYQHSEEHISSYKNLALGDFQLAFKYYSDCAFHHNKEFANSKILNAAVNLLSVGSFDSKAYSFIKRNLDLFLLMQILFALAKLPKFFMSRVSKSMKIFIIGKIINRK